MTSITNECWLTYRVVLLSIVLVGCSSTPQSPAQQSASRKAEARAEPSGMPNPIQALSSPSPGSKASPGETAKLPPPKPAEINNAVARIFEATASYDSVAQPSFVVGDFNGDGSEDLAVAVKPDESKLNAINSEVANWILEDPGNVAIPGATTGPPKSTRAAHAEKGNSLLAIIHGVGGQGWRNTEARQSFLLKNGVGERMALRTAAQVRSAREMRALPPLKGDAIQETIAGKSGLLFWTGAKYAWYSPPSTTEATLR